jgi:hypothetical protein
MSQPAFRTEERIGLFVAIAAHVALFAWLAWQRPAAPPPPPERMTVTLSDTVGLTATAPNPAPEAAPDTGPDLGEPAPSPDQATKAAPAKPAPPQPAPPQPAPPKPAIAPKAPAVPAKPAAKPALTAKQAAATQTATKTTAAKTPAKAGASRFDQAFAKGVPGAAGKSPVASPPAAAFGPQQQSALRSAIFRQIKPHWVAPQGIDAEKLVTVVRFKLNQGGRLIGEPTMVSQTGQTPANAAQTRRHFEQAVRAIKLTQPFILPPDLYPYWQTVTSTFDKKLSQ